MAPTSPLAAWIEWFFGELGVADVVSIPPFVLSRAFLSSRQLYFLLSFVFFPAVLTQSFNRLRSTQLLSFHHQLGWVFIARNRWDQSGAESVAVLCAIMAMAAATIALNAHALHAGPYLTWSADTWREAEEKERRSAAEAVEPLSTEAAAEERVERQWQVLLLLALLLCLGGLLRFMASVSALPAPPQRRSALDAAH